MSNTFVYINGQFISKADVTISPFDHGFLYGLGVFETIRTYEGHPFLLDDHLERLNYGLASMQINRQFQRSEVMLIIEELSSLNKLDNSYIRFNVSSGVGEIGLQTTPYEAPTIIMFQKPLQHSELKEKEAVIVQISRNTPETNIRLKSHHFFNNVAAKRELGPNLDKEGIFLTNEGFLAEGITSNLFWVNNGVLYTPALETGILNGITRMFVISLANKLQLQIKEGLYRETVLMEADEVFFTNSIQEIVPVSMIQGKQLPGKHGQYVQRLNQLYQKYVHTYWSINDVINQKST